MNVSYGLLVILCCFPVYCQRLTAISSITKPFIRDLGSTASITCTVFNPLKYNISWVKIHEPDDANPVILSIGNKVLINDSRFSLVQDIISTKHYDSNCYTLKILNFHKTDAGFYRCIVLDNTNDMISADTEIQLRTPPTITSAPSPLIHIMLGDPLTLECFARGVPMPIVAWTRENNATLTTGESIHRGNVLEFKAVKREDTGLYYCSAKNGVHYNVYQEFNIIVLFPPLVSSSKPYRTQVLNQFIDLHCHVEGLPTPSIVWIHNEDPIMDNAYFKIHTLASSHSVTDSVLYIYRVEKYLFGNYICRASNTWGTAEVTITIKEISV